MDEMKFKLVTATVTMRNFINKEIKKVLFKKFGYDMNSMIKELEFSTNDGKTRLHINADFEISNSDFMRIIGTIMAHK